MKKSILTAALALTAGIFTTAQADEKNEPKDSKPEVAAAGTGSVKWFRFEGTPSQTGDASKYVEVPAAECPVADLPQRCEIQIMSQGTSPDLPDLTQSVQAETRKSS